MAKRKGLFRYLKAAFSAKPKGMLLSPNWIGLAAVVFLGLFLNPGFFAIGAALELAYLLTLGTNARFQHFVDAVDLQKEEARKIANMTSLFRKLSPDSQKRYTRLQQRCQSILALYLSLPGAEVGGDLLQNHVRNLNKFLWIFLQLLGTKDAMMTFVEEGSISPEFRSTLQRKIEVLEQRLGTETMTDDMRGALQSKLDILRRRLDTLGEVENKLKYIHAEIERIEHKIELLREQAAISKDSGLIASRIDEVSTSLGETTKWIKEQQRIFSLTEALTQEAPPVLAPPSALHGMKDQ